MNKWLRTYYAQCHIGGEIMGVYVEARNYTEARKAVSRELRSDWQEGFFTEQEWMGAVISSIRMVP